MSVLDIYLVFINVAVCCNNLLSCSDINTHDLHINLLFHLISYRKIVIDVIKNCSLKITLPTDYANFCFHIFNDIELTLQHTMLSFDLLFSCFTTTELTNYGSSSRAYTDAPQPYIFNINIPP